MFRGRIAFGRSDVPNLVTVTMGLTASLSLAMSALGRDVLAVRLAFLALSLDVLDGYLARKLGAVTEKGALLDRLFDRLYQVVLPATLYVRLMQGDPLAIVYCVAFITLSYVRIVERPPSRRWFMGLPLNVHMIVVLSSFARGGRPIPPWLMLALLALSAVRIRYVKYSLRGEMLEEASDVTYPVRLAVPLALALIPYEGPALLAFEVLFWAALAYAALGWVPAYLVRRAGP